jgi:hypothetical protein
LQPSVDLTLAGTVLGSALVVRLQHDVLRLRGLQMPGMHGDQRYGSATRLSEGVRHGSLGGLRAVDAEDHWPVTVSMTIITNDDDRTLRVAGHLPGRRAQVGKGSLPQTVRAHHDTVRLA